MAIRQSLPAALELPADQPSRGDTVELGQRPEDRECLARLRAGDARAYEALFREYYGPLCGFTARYVESPQLAEELVEDLFVRIWEQRESLAVRGNLRAYLYAAARYQALNHRRHAAVEGRVLGRLGAEGVAPGMGRHAVPTDHGAEAEELRLAVAGAIESLPERCRLVFTMRWQQHLSYAEIAVVLGISVKTVENQVNRALKALRERLRLYW